MSTLADRIRTALAGPPRRSQAALARHCGVKPPSVSAWLSGDTKTIEGSNLLKAAEFLGVRAKWLSDGVGPMRAGEDVPAPAPQVSPPPGPAPDIHIALEAIAKRLMGADQGIRELVAGMLASMARNPDSFSQVAIGLRAILSSSLSDEGVEVAMPATKTFKGRVETDQEGDGR